MICFRSRRPKRFLSPGDTWRFESCRENVFWRAWEEHGRRALLAKIAGTDKFALN